MRRILSVLLLLGVLALALPTPAYAAPPEEDRVVFGDNFVLENGQVLDGDLVIFGGNATLEDGSRVTGAIFVMGGNADIAGVVDGDLALLGGNVSLRETAWIHGDVAAIGGHVNRAAGARIDGQVTQGQQFTLPFDFNMPFVDSWRFGRDMGPLETVRVGLSPLMGLVWFGFRTLLIAAVAVLVVMFWPVPTERTGRAAVAQPILGGGLGLLTIVVAPILLLVLAITILLIPISFIGLVLLLVALLFGWIALGLEVGQRLAESFHWALHPPAAAGVGTLVLGLVVGGIGLIPCVGWLAPFLVGSIGLGAVMLTRFGAQEYVGGGMTSSMSAPAPLPPAPPEPASPPAKNATVRKTARKTTRKSTRKTS